MCVINFFLAIGEWRSISVSPGTRDGRACACARDGNARVCARAGVRRGDRPADRDAVRREQGEPLQPEQGDVQPDRPPAAERRRAVGRQQRPRSAQV